jgi:hypothetical protein
MYQRDRGADHRKMGWGGGTGGEDFLVNYIRAKKPDRPNLSA